MKVILKSEVDNVGLPGDVVDVANGYGRNFLIPRGMAILATRGAMKEAEALTRSRKAREAKTVAGAQASKDALEARTLRIPARVDERGSLYGSVGAADVQRVLKERGHEIQRRRIELRGTIKEIGSYEIPVQVHPQVMAILTVEVVDEEGKVRLEGGIVADVDEAGVADAAADAAAGTDTDADVLAAQAIAAAQEHDQQQAAVAAEREAAGAAPPDDVADDTVVDAEEPAGS